MKCMLCESEEFFEDKQSLLCSKCKLLYNKNAFLKDYANGGGQGIPSVAKRKMRLENSEARFKLLEEYILKKSLLIDIGSGSGEMLEISKKYTEEHLGFDTNKILIDYCKKNNLKVKNNFFEKKYIENVEYNNKQKIFTACHVIEHMDNPLKFTQEIYNSMSVGDVFFIEVPLYTGDLFDRKKYKANIWINEHIALYSLDSLKYLAKKMNFEILEMDYRNFINESKSKSYLFKKFLRNPFLFIYRLISKKAKQQIADNIFRDYGYIILKK